MIIIDGKKTAQEIKNEIKTEVVKIKEQNNKIPHLSIILVGHDGGSETYVSHKIKDCEEVGFKSSLFRYEDNVSENVVLSKIKELNDDENVHGIIVQLPLPKHISEKKVIEAIDYKKDVDGFHPINIGRMVIGLPSYIPATPMGIMELIRRYKIETDGKNCVVIGRSNIVGRPISILLSQKSKPGNCTVTVCHSQTPDIKSLTIKADIIIAAIGKPSFLKADFDKDGAVVIDVGTTRIKDDNTKSGWKLVGDVDFAEVSTKCSYITPVPGGVGPMTRAALLINTFKAAKGEVY